MGAFRDRANALGVKTYFPLATSNYSQDAGYWYTYGERSDAAIISMRAFADGHQASLVKTETNLSLAGGGDIFDGRILALGANAASQTDATLVFTGTLEEPATATNPMWIPDPLAPGDGAWNSRGFLQVHEDHGVPEKVAYWDLHVTTSDTIGIATWGSWGDEPQGEFWGGWRLYQYDTGIPVGALMDGRPHLISLRAHGQDQGNFNTSVPLAQNNWIKLDIDDTYHYLSARGPAWMASGGPMVWFANFTGLDEMAAFEKQLTDAEVASLATPAVWGTEWPYSSGATFTMPVMTTSLSNSLTRAIGLMTTQRATFRALDADPVWIEQASEGVALADAVFPALGTEGTWDGAPAWNPSRPNTPASRWLDEVQVQIKLLSTPILGLSQMTGELQQQEQAGGLIGSEVSGHSSILVSLSLNLKLEAAEATGSSSVTGIFGDVQGWELVGTEAAGSSIVSGDLWHGQLETLAPSGIIAGTSSMADADLLVHIGSHIGGGEEDDDWGEDGSLPPSLGGGKRRAKLSPKSIGRTTSKSPWEVTR